MLQHLISAFRHDKPSQSTAIAYYVEKGFEEGNLEQVIEYINKMFSTIPYPIFDAKKEKYYHSLIHTLFTYVGLYIKSEVTTSKGRVDAIVEVEERIYILEFKLDKTAQKAIEQIKEKGYAEQFNGSEKQLVAFGINFSSKEKQVNDWKTEVLNYAE